MPEQSPDESVPLMENDNPHSPVMEGGEASLDKLSLKLEGKQFIALRDDALVISGTTIKRSYCFPSKPQEEVIPFYNILWIECKGEQLVIDYTRLQGQQLVVAKFVGRPVNVDKDILTNWAQTALHNSYGNAKLNKRCLVLVNPASGPGGAVKQWTTECQPIFEAARISFDAIITTHGGHAMDICQQMDLDNFDVVVGCAGDGMPYEIFNGLGRRPDATKALAAISVAHLPCGSGNGMSCNLYGTHKPSLATLAIVKGVTTPLDLVSVTQGDRRTLSFMSQNVGIIAECDLATEHLRWMGDTRFVVGFLQRVLKGTTYPCDIAAKVEIAEAPQIKAHYHREQSQTDLNVRAAREAAEGGADSENSLPPLKYGTTDNEIPDDWEVIKSDKLGCLYVGNMAYMDRTNNFFSAACASDGLLDMITVDADIGTMQWIKLMDAVEKGTLLDNPNVTYKKISAFRVTPRDQEDGYISIDGERIPFAPFQCEVHKGLGRVISKSGTFEGPGPGVWDTVTLAERMHA